MLPRPLQLVLSFFIELYLTFWKKKASISPSKLASTTAHTMSQLHHHTVLFLFVKQQVKPSAVERDFLLPVAAGPPEHQLPTEGETLTPLTHYFRNTPSTCKAKPKTLQRFCYRFCVNFSSEYTEEDSVHWVKHTKFGWCSNTPHCFSEV